MTPRTLFCERPSHPSSKYSKITFILVFAHVTKQESATDTLRDPTQISYLGYVQMPVVTHLSVNRPSTPPDVSTGILRYLGCSTL